MDMQYKRVQELITSGDKELIALGIQLSLALGQEFCKNMFQPRGHNKTTRWKNSIKPGVSHLEGKCFVKGGMSLVIRRGVITYRNFSSISERVKRKLVIYEVD